MGNKTPKETEEENVFSNLTPQDWSIIAGSSSGSYFLSEADKKAVHKDIEYFRSKRMTLGVIPISHLSDEAKAVGIDKLRTQILNELESVCTIRTQPHGSKLRKAFNKMRPRNITKNGRPIKDLIHGAYKYTVEAWSPTPRVISKRLQEDLTTIELLG